MIRQESFSTLWDGYSDKETAKKARNQRMKELRTNGIKCNGWVLRNQMKKYDGLGQYNGGVCDVYMINIWG